MIQTASYTDIGGRPCNEDSCRFLSAGANCLLAVVADGLGGHGGGELASSTAVQTICSGWNGQASAGELNRLIQTAHRQVLALQTGLCAMKTTAVVLALADDRAVWAHVGDSRLYYFRDGKLILQTRDHSASQIAVMLGDITPDQIRFHEDRNRVLRALGQDGELKVDTREEALRPGQHIFLLCTDGFWEYVTEAEMEADLAAAAGPADWLERMRKRLQARVPADNDNNTAAAVWLNHR